MRPGDLIAPLFHEGVPVFNHWGGEREVPKVIGKFTPECVGILLEDGLERGGNGVKILTSCGTVGWVYRSEVDVVG